MIQKASHDWKGWILEGRVDEDVRNILDRGTNDGTMDHIKKSPLAALKVQHLKDPYRMLRLKFTAPTGGNIWVMSGSTIDLSELNYARLYVFMEQQKFPVK
jgi:hypothetical protein